MTRKKKPQRAGYNAKATVINSNYQNLKPSEEESDINILLLGETGVGKSTFINGFFNYITFPSLLEARKENLQVVIPTQFTITDENYQEKLVKVGEDYNESIEIGASATQTSRSYVFPDPESGRKIRLIDTPGVGDTRGIDQDNINFENVLTFIGELQYLNAICILLKPNHSRLTVMFEFCIKQLLSKLEKSASHNLLFVFTNTRSTFYRPGETLPLFKSLLSTVKVNIPCDKSNIFCTDNESFRFLAALKNNIQFTSADVENFSQSWTHSYNECLRMIKYIVGDGTTAGLSPHKVQDTVSINEARRLIVQLSQPLAEISQVIQDNIRAVDAHKKLVATTKNTLSELSSKLYIPVIDLKVTKLNQPITVCTSIQCSELYQVGNKRKWHFRQKCHSPCYLKNVPKEIIGSPELINCKGMDNYGTCRTCFCRYQVHMHLYYKTETFENKLEDKLIKTHITNKKEAIQIGENFTLKLSIRLSKLRQEILIITKTTAKFACFLKANAMSPYNDSYEAYLKYLIDRERSLNDACNFTTIQQMERSLSEYVHEKNIINTMPESNSSNTIITANDIMNSIKHLYSLEFSGAKIEQLFEAQNRARNSENKSQTKELVFRLNLSRNRRNSVKRLIPSRSFSNTPRIHNQNSSAPGPSLRQTNISANDWNEKEPRRRNVMDLWQRSNYTNTSEYTTVAQTREHVNNSLPLVQSHHQTREHVNNSLPLLQSHSQPREHINNSLPLVQSHHKPKSTKLKVFETALNVFSFFLNEIPS